MESESSQELREESQPRRSSQDNQLPAASITPPTSLALSPPNTPSPSHAHSSPVTPSPPPPVALDSEGGKATPKGEGLSPPSSPSVTRSSPPSPSVTRSPPPSPSVTRVSRVREGDDVVTRRETATTQTLSDKVVTTTETESTKTLPDGTIVRKKSIRRRVSQKGGEAPGAGEAGKGHGEEAGKGYGGEAAQYQAIVQGVLGEPQYRGALEMLQERLKMVRMMQEDCQAMVAQWQEERLQRRLRQQRRSLQLGLALASVLVVPVLCWVLF